MNDSEQDQGVASEHQLGYLARCLFRSNISLGHELKVRSLNQLSELIDEDLAWRKRELLVFVRQISVASKGDDVKQVLLRASVALLYAHWEGFVKNCCHWYLAYVASRRLRVDEARSELVALANRRELNEASHARRLQVHVNVVASIREGGSSRLTLPARREDVKTESNLSYAVLNDLLLSIGCSISNISLYEDIIDDNLLALRNRVAHGEQDTITDSVWLELKDAIVTLMDAIADEILNSAATESYLAESPSFKR